MEKDLFKTEDLVHSYLSSFDEILANLEAGFQIDVEWLIKY